MPADRRSNWIRRLAGPLAVLALIASSVAGASADTQSELQGARNRLHALEDRIASQRARLDDLRTRTDQIAAKVSAAQAKLERTGEELDATRADLQRTRARYRVLQGRLNERARQAFMEGPLSGLDFMLGSDSFAEFTDRMEFVNAATQSDSDVANQIQGVANLLAIKQTRLETLESDQAKALAEVQRQQAALEAQLAEQQRIYEDLADSKSELTSLVDDLAKKLAAEERAAAQAAAQAAAAPVGTSSGSGGASGPLQTCPVAGPHSYSDDFGAPRYGGGYHTHAGNDIFAPMGTPIVAPFPGSASNSTNTLGGLSVTVSGSQGFVYNAHMSRIGQLGSVSTGDVIGYVGNSGDAQGGSPHDHFEWHPGGGGAVDPFPYLNQVC